MKTYICQHLQILGIVESATMSKGRLRISIPNSIPPLGRCFSTSVAPRCISAMKNIECVSLPNISWVSDLGFLGIGSRPIGGSDLSNAISRTWIGPAALHRLHVSRVSPDCAQNSFRSTKEDYLYGCGYNSCDLLESSRISLPQRSAKKDFFTR